jgi:hypothetical protein
LEKAEGVFEKKSSENAVTDDIEKLYTKIGQLEVENDFLKKNLKKAGL